MIYYSWPSALLLKSLPGLTAGSSVVLRPEHYTFKPARFSAEASRDIRSAYDAWVDQYDTKHNKTRDLQGLALQTSLAGLFLGHCLEIGCGTDKNTAWLLQKALTVTALDFSNQMLARELMLTWESGNPSSNIPALRPASTPPKAGRYLPATSTISPVLCRQPESTACGCWIWASISTLLTKPAFPASSPSCFRKQAPSPVDR